VTGKEVAEMADGPLLADHITLTRFAKLVGVSRDTISDLIRQGRLPYLKLGKRRILIPRAAAHDLIQPTRAGGG
jgi:excisionase family DNA binding protein